MKIKIKRRVLFPVKMFADLIKHVRRPKKMDSTQNSIVEACPDAFPAVLLAAFVRCRQVPEDKPWSYNTKGWSGAHPQNKWILKIAVPKNLISWR